MPIDDPGCNSAHNALTINTTRDTVANFRESCDTTDTTTMASFDYFAKHANGPSSSVSLSNNGKYIAFVSDATNFGGQSGFGDIFLYNRESGLVSLVSSHGGGTGGHSSSPVVSGDGRFIGFASAAQNLQNVGANPNGAADIYARDQAQSPFLRRISLSSEEAFPNNNSYAPSISYDGRYMAFESDADNLLDGQDLDGEDQIPDTNTFRDIFVRDRNVNEDLDFDDAADSYTQRVSISTAEVQANGDSRAPSISASLDPAEDGRYVAFESDASNLLDDGSDTNGYTDIFVRDLLAQPTPLTVRVSVSTDPSEPDPNNDSFAPAVSFTGNLVAFESDATNLVDGDGPGYREIFVHNIGLATTVRISVGLLGAEPDGDSFAPTISADERYVAFYSEATNLVEDDSNGLADVFVYDRNTQQLARVSVSTDPSNPNPNGDSSAPSLSGDGRFVAFDSDATNLVGVCVPNESGDCNGVNDVFFRDRGSCVGDLDGDGEVGALDLAMLLAAWGSVENCPPLIVHDLDKDCEIGPVDLAMLLAAWGPCS